MAIDRQCYVRRLADQFGYHYLTGSVTEPPQWFIETAQRMFDDGVRIDPIEFAVAELMERAGRSAGGSR